MNLEKLFNAKAYKTSKSPTFLTKIFNYVKKPDTGYEKIYLTPGNDFKATVKIISIKTGWTEEETIQKITNLGLNILEGVLLEDMKLYVKESDEELREFKVFH